VFPLARRHRQLATRSAERERTASVAPAIARREAARKAV
jgi:hypothetical protein